MSDVTVVILNWNGVKFLEQFLPSVIKYSPDTDIVVADNYSTDDSLTFLKNNFAGKIKVIAFSSNLGYCKGYNEALRLIKSRYYILLNSDVEVTEGWITPMINLLENNPTVAACQPKIKNFYHKGFFEYAGAGGGFLDKYGYPFCRGRIFETLEEDSGQYDDEVEIFWATGAALCIRAENYWEVGGLDEEFFAHMEEIDLCWRLKNKGYKILYTGKSTVYHVGGGTLNKSNPHKTFLNFKNGLFLLYKNLPQKGFLFTVFIRMLLDGVAAIKYLSSFSILNFNAVFKAHVHFYKNISRLRVKRRLRKANSLPSEIYKRSIVKDYYIFKKKKFKNLIW